MLDSRRAAEFLPATQRRGLEVDQTFVVLIGAFSFWYWHLSFNCKKLPNFEII